MTEAFDYVEWNASGGTSQRVDGTAFLDIPLPVRVRGLLGQEFRFYKGGHELPASEALNRMAQASMGR